MNSSYQATATAYGIRLPGSEQLSAHDIINALHRKASKLAPRFADDTADAGCTNLRPSDAEPRRQQVWDILAEALSWNLIADYPQLVAAAKANEHAFASDPAHVASTEVGNDFSTPGTRIFVRTPKGETVHTDRVADTVAAYQAAGISWTTSGGKVWPADLDYEPTCFDCQDQIPHRTHRDDTFPVATPEPAPEPQATDFCRHCGDDITQVNDTWFDDRGQFTCSSARDGRHYPARPQINLVNRLAQLRERGYFVTQLDATTYRATSQYDNPTLVITITAAGTNGRHHDTWTEEEVSP
jgi:hypothetical protein